MERGQCRRSFGFERMSSVDNPRLYFTWTLAALLRSTPGDARQVDLRASSLPVNSPNKSDCCSSGLLQRQPAPPIILSLVRSTFPKQPKRRLAVPLNSRNLSSNYLGPGRWLNVTIVHQRRSSSSCRPSHAQLHRSSRRSLPTCLWPSSGIPLWIPDCLRLDPFDRQCLDVSPAPAN